MKVDFQFVVQTMFIIWIVANPTTFGWALFTIMFYPEIKGLFKEILTFLQ